MSQWGSSFDFGENTKCCNVVSHIGRRYSARSWYSCWGNLPRIVHRTSTSCPWLSPDGSSHWGADVTQKSCGQFTSCLNHPFWGLRQFKSPNVDGTTVALHGVFQRLLLYPPPCPCRASTAPPHHVAPSAPSLGTRRRDSPRPSLPEDLLAGIQEGRKNR